MEKTASASEHYDKEQGHFVLVGKCPICKTKNYMLSGKMIVTCTHFVREAHGCGGTIFVFRDKGKKRIRRIWEAITK